MFIDAVFVLLLLFACINGYRKGLILASFSILAFIAGLAAAIKFSSIVAARLSANINSTGKWIPVLSFIAVFLIVALIINRAARLLQKSVEFILLGWINRVGGVILFALLYSIIFSVFLFYAHQLNLLNEKNINATLIAFCILMASFMFFSSKMYRHLQVKQSQIEMVNTLK